MFDFTKNECGKLIGTEQQQILQLYEFIKVLAKNSFAGFEIMGTYVPTVNYNKKYMLVFEDGSTYIRIADGDCVGLSPKLNADKWALFSSGTLAELDDLESLIVGSDTVVVDRNEAGTALEIHADYETIIKPIERAIKTPLQFPSWYDNIVACLNKNTGQFFPPLSQVTEPNAVVQRNDFGEISVPDDPRYDYNAVNKKWVENKIAQSGGGTKLYLYEINASYGDPLDNITPPYDSTSGAWEGMFRMFIVSKSDSILPVFNENEAYDTEYEEEGANNSEKFLSSILFDTYDNEDVICVTFSNTADFTGRPTQITALEYPTLYFGETTNESGINRVVFSRYRVLNVYQVTKTEL